MDVYCKVCGEPWDNDTLHDYVEENGGTYQEIARTFRSKGCGVAFAEWSVTCEPRKGRDTEALGLLYDLLGDDMDGASAEYEDFLRFV